MIEENNPEVFTRYGIKRHHFQTQAEKEAFDFLSEYIRENHQVCDYRTLVSSIRGEFTFMPKVADNFDYLSNQLKDYSAKVQMASVLQKELQEQFDELSGQDFLKWLQEKAELITQDTSIRKGVGKTLTELKDEMKSEYEKRKAGKSFKLWKTPFETVNAEIGGLFSSDIYGVFAESGRGKSYLIIAIVDELLRQGAKVLVKSYELRSYIWLSRLFSIITAREGLIENEFGIKVGLPNKEILSGKLSGESEEYFLHMLEKINSYYPGELFLQAKGDKELSRTLDELDRELNERPDIDAVILDPFYGLTDVYGKNTNKTTGGAAEQAARRFEVICGVHDVVGLYSVQATVEKQKTTDEGRRELKLPKRDQLKTTKALLDIATCLFSFDSCDSVARLGIEKGRNSGEGLEVELIALLDHGVLKEPSSGENLTAQFDMENF